MNATKAKNQLELVKALRKELADWVHEYNTVGRLEDELTKLEEKQVSECDPLDNTAVNQLARTKTQLVLIPHRRKRALDGQRAVAEKLMPAADDLRRACAAMADEESARFTDKIAALLAPYCQTVVERNGERSDRARQLAGQCDVHRHIYYSSQLQNRMPDISDFSNTPERAAAGLLEYADEGIAILTRFFSRKEPSFVHPDFAKEPVVVRA